MSRTLTLLFRRDPSRDRHTDKVHFEGYEPLWPDGRPVSIGVDAFCKHGQRLLGLGKCLAGCKEKLVKMVLFPLRGVDDDLNRIPGYRVRRFYMALTGAIGRLHFMDGTPTVATFDVQQDDPRILRWFGLNEMSDGEILWFDLAAVAMDEAMSTNSHVRTVEA